MNKIILISTVLIFSLLNFNSAIGEEFNSFYQAKRHLISKVNNETRTIYCNCPIKKVGQKLTPITNKCGYKPRLKMTRSGNVNVRAKRIEWEHIVPASKFGGKLQCWKDGGRENCRRNSKIFKRMEADINNLAPAIGEINVDRSNYRFVNMLPNTPKRYGSCNVKIDFHKKAIEPPKKARKRIAEAYFYMQKMYGLEITGKQEKMFKAWLKNNMSSP